MAVPAKSNKETRGGDEVEAKAKNERKECEQPMPRDERAKRHTGRSRGERSRRIGSWMGGDGCGGRTTNDGQHGDDNSADVT